MAYLSIIASLETFHTRGIYLISASGAEDSKMSHVWSFSVPQVEMSCVFVEALACYSVADVRCSGQCICPELFRDMFVQKNCANDVF